MLLPPMVFHVVRVVLFRTDFTYYHGMAYFLSLVCQNVMVVNAKESVSTGHVLGAGGLPRANGLAEMAELIGVGGIPSGFVSSLVLELAMLRNVTSGWVKD
jgi:hypothetical protein